MPSPFQKKLDDLLYSARHIGDEYSYYDDDPHFFEIQSMKNLLEDLILYLKEKEQTDA